MTTIIFVRHAHTAVDPTSDARDWTLSVKGITQSESVSAELLHYPINALYCSSEIKTTLTVAPITESLGIKTINYPELDEVIRSSAFYSDEDFAREKEQQLRDLSYGAFQGETGLDALLRFRNKLNDICAQHPDETIVVCSHGTILSIFFASLINDESADLYTRWRNCGFASYGIVEYSDGHYKITRDIV